MWGHDQEDLDVKCAVVKIEQNRTYVTEQDNGLPSFESGDHIIDRRNENNICYHHHAIVTDLQICSEVKFKRNVEITKVQMANQEEPRKRLSKNDEPCHIMQNHKTCTETSQNYARSLVNGSEKLKISKVEHDIKGGIKYGLIESIKQFLNKVGNFDLMTTTRSGGKLRLTLLLLLMLSTAHSKPVDKMEFSSVYASSSGSISCHEMGKYVCMYSTEIRNMTCNSLKLLTRPHTCIRVICYDAKQQICCRQTIYNFSSHLFQKYYGTELHNPAMQMFLEGYSLLLRTTVKIAVAVLVWMTFSAVKQYKEMEKVITWMEILGEKHIFFTETATANHLTYFERLGLLLRHFSCMIAGICVLAIYANDVLTKKEVILRKRSIKVKSFEEGHVDCVMSEESLLTIKDNTGESFLKVQEVEEVKDIHEQDENIYELLLEKCKEKISTKDKIVYLSNTVQTENYRKPMETDIHEETSAKAVVNRSFSETDGMNNHNKDPNDLSDSSRLSINDFREDQEFGVTENGYNIRLCTETSEIEPMRSEISFCRSFEVDGNVSPVGHCTCHADENSGREKVWLTLMVTCQIQR
ncbi:unnamed protein product [Mytilus edulis]|uniref:Uncharacterized protein n=1 Tax=Mytilus edulis TaxID=6550 RepID=A0A8S3RYM7_MYTED|nr:unnamed protein product [Mytilus edulis]